MAETPQHHLLCIRCREITIVTPETLQTLSACPHCGSLSSPADTVTPTLTVHELRILTIWAANWEDHMRRTSSAPAERSAIAGICAGLAQYTDAPLSISQEIADLRAQPGVSNATVVDTDGNPSGL